jgi:hypothetical protein
MNLDNGVNFLKDDEITVRITREDEFAASVLTLVGYDPHTKFDKLDNPESSLDEPYYSEEIIIDPSEGEE